MKAGLFSSSGHETVCVGGKTEENLETSGAAP